MKAERWQEVERLYHAALGRETEERAAFLREACDGDAELCKEVESLLEYESRAERFIESPALEVAAGLMAEAQTSSMTGQTISHYQILASLGTGGMGEVYLAEDAKLHRRASLAHIMQSYEWNWAGAEREFQRAFELNPSYATAHQWYAFYLVGRG